MNEGLKRVKKYAVNMGYFREPPCSDGNLLWDTIYHRNNNNDANKVFKISKEDAVNMGDFKSPVQNKSECISGYELFGALKYSCGNKFYTVRTVHNF